MIELKNISFSYINRNRESVKNINLSVKEGEFVVLTGLSGCGKTTITRILNGLCPKFYDGELNGEYLLDEKNGKNMSISELSSYWGSVFQDPRSQFFCKKARDEIVLGMENHCFTRGIMSEKLDEVSIALNIEHLLEKDMTHLSSGEKQKIAIASVLACDPKGYILDEPSANLDPNMTINLSLFLKRIKAKGRTVIIAEHRLFYLKDLIDRLIIMKDGEIIKDLSKKDIKQLDNEMLAKYGIRGFELPSISPGDNYYAKDGILKCNGIKYAAKNQIILKDIYAEFEEGKVHAILGENGAGKSSLCRVITGLYKENQGSLLINQIPRKRKERYKNTFFVGQDVDYQLYGSSLEEEFKIGNGKGYTNENIENTLYKVGITKDIKINPQTLSTGEKQRLLVSIASLSDKKIIVFDEPTSGLDGYHMGLMTDLLRQLANDGKTIIVITHDIEFIAKVSDSVCFLSKGDIKYHKFIDRKRG